MLIISYLAKIGIGIPASNRILCRGSYSLDLESCVFAGTIAFETPVISPGSCRTASGSLSLANKEYYVGVGTIGVATLVIGLPSSCRKLSQGSSLLHSDSCVSSGTLGVATLVIGLMVPRL